MFWLSLIKIAWIDLILSGDNALVIALVCQTLPPRQRFYGMLFGAGAAIALRIVLTGAVSLALTLPGLQLLGGLILIYIAIKLAAGADNEKKTRQAMTLWAAVGLITLADLSMSIDNIIAVATAASGDVVLLALGLAISIPCILAGASLIVLALDRFPYLIYLGSAVLLWVALQAIFSDPLGQRIINYVHTTI